MMAVQRTGVLLHFDLWPSSGSATSHTRCRQHVKAVFVSPGCCQEGSGGQEASIGGGAWSISH